MGMVYYPWPIVFWSRLGALQRSICEKLKQLKKLVEKR